MVFLDIPVARETVVQALRVPPASASVSASSGPVGCWVGLGAGWDALRAFSGARAHPQPLLGFLAGRNGVIALLLGLLPTVSLNLQFVPRPLEGLFHKLPLAVRTQDRLAPGKPLVGQFCLEVMDRRLSLVEEMFCTLFVP
jgi:hypothetical protein